MAVIQIVLREISTHFEIFQWKPLVLAHKHSKWQSTDKPEDYENRIEDN